MNIKHRDNKYGIKIVCSVMYQIKLSNYLIDVRNLAPGSTAIYPLTSALVNMSANSKFMQQSSSEDEDFLSQPLRSKYVRIPAPLPMDWLGWSNSDGDQCIQSKMNSSGNDLLIEPGQSCSTEVIAQQQESPDVLVQDTDDPETYEYLAPVENDPDTDEEVPLVQRYKME